MIMKERAKKIENIKRRIKKIRRIKIPGCVKSVSGNCFGHLYDKSKVVINIPESAGDFSVLHLWKDWKMIKFPKKNKYWKFVDGYLIQKKNNALYGVPTWKSKLIIPKVVKSIEISQLEGVKELRIPKNVKSIADFNFDSDTYIKIKISKKNKNYKIKKGNIISKKPGRLVVGVIKKGILKVPKGVKKIGTNGFVGKNLKKLIIPSSVKEVVELLAMPRAKKFVCICKGKKPPKMTRPCSYAFLRSLKIYVPKGSLEEYESAWADLQRVFTGVEFIEM